MQKVFARLIQNVHCLDLLYQPMLSLKAAQRCIEDVEEQLENLLDMIYLLLTVIGKGFVLVPI